MNKLNLGCGTNIKKGYINLDQFKYPGVDVIHNLNKYPYPFKDNSFDEILLLDILEHLKNPDKCIRELWRISKNKSKIKIKVPHFTSINAWNDMTHIRSFSQNSMMPFDINQKPTTSLEYHQKEKFIIKKKIIMTKFYRNNGIEFLANKFPEYYEKFFSYIFTTQEIRFILTTIK